MEFSIGPLGSDNLLQPSGIREISNCRLRPPAPQFGFEADNLCHIGLNLSVIIIPQLRK